MSSSRSPREERVTEFDLEFDFPPVSQGLLNAEVERRRLAFGFNEVVPKKVTRPFLRRIERKLYYIL